MILKKSFYFATAVAISASVAFGEGAANGFFAVNKFFYTLSPDVHPQTSNNEAMKKKIEGPIYNVDTDNKSEYVTGVFKRLVLAAYEIAAPMREKDPKLFWSYLTGALIVPFHESRLTQLREHSDLLTPDGKSICSIGMNNGQLLASNKAVYSIFATEMKNKGLVPDCSKLDQKKPHVQIAGSMDILSTGIMQIAMNWHKAHVEKGDHLKVFYTLKYGLDKYFKTVKRIHDNYQKHACLVKAGGRNYEGIVKGAWSGDYNSGNDGQTCRFTNPAHPWAANDVGFKQSFNLVVNGAGKHLYSENLSGAERQIYTLIIQNFKSLNANPNSLGTQNDSFNQLKDYISKIACDTDIKGLSTITCSNAAIATPVPAANPPVAVVSSKTQKITHRVEYNGVTAYFADKTPFIGCGTLTKNQGLTEIGKQTNFEWTYIKFSSPTPVQGCKGEFYVFSPNVVKVI